MYLPLKFICNSRKKRKNGTSIIFIQYCYSPVKKLLLNTEISIPPEHWIEKKQVVSTLLPAEYGDAFFLNMELRRMFRSVEDIAGPAFKMKIEEVGEFVKKLFSPQFQPASLEQVEREIDAKDVRKNPDIYFQIDDYIQRKTRKVCKDMPRIYRNMKDHLQEFEDFRAKPITFESLDLTFYEDFVDFLMYDYVQRRRKNRIVGLKVKYSRENN